MNVLLAQNRFLLFILYLLFPLFFCPSVHADGLQTQLNQAYASYMEGVNADTVAERQQAYNRALKLYAQLEKEPGNGKLLYNIGNAYYELGEYGWAIYYYRLAQQLLPRDHQVRQQLNRALVKQGLPAPVERPVAQNALYWQYKMSQSERILLFLALLTATFALASLYVWARREAVKILLGVFTACSTILLGSILYAQYFAPIEAVVVGAYGLYHSPSEESAVISVEPLIPGTTLEIRGMINDGPWLKVILPTGQTGYLPSEAARVML